MLRTRDYWISLLAYTPDSYDLELDQKLGLETTTLVESYEVT